MNTEQPPTTEPRYPAETVTAVVFDVADLLGAGALERVAGEIAEFTGRVHGQARVLLIGPAGWRELNADHADPDELAALLTGDGWQPNPRPADGAARADLAVAAGLDLRPGETAVVHSSPGAVAASVGAGLGLVIGLDLAANAGALLSGGADVVIVAMDELEIDGDGTWKLRSSDHGEAVSKPVAPPVR
jgi:hypothetical protein